MTELVINLTPTMLRAATSLKYWYALPANTTGGALHIVVDDFNVQDTNLDFCESEFDAWAEYLDEEWDGRAEIYKKAMDDVLKFLRALTIEDRDVVVRRYPLIAQLRFDPNTPDFTINYRRN